MVHVVPRKCIELQINLAVRFIRPKAIVAAESVFLCTIQEKGTTKKREKTL